MGAIAEFTAEVKSDIIWLLPVSAELTDRVYKTAITHLWDATELVCDQSFFFCFFFLSEWQPKYLQLDQNWISPTPKPQVAPRFWARKSGSRARNLYPKKLRWNLTSWDPKLTGTGASSGHATGGSPTKSERKQNRQSNKLWTVLNLAYPVALHSSPPLSVMVIVVCFRLQVTKSLRVQSHFKTTSTTTTPSLWMEITQNSSLRFIHYRQIKIWRKSLSPYFGRPTKSMLVAD